MRYCSLASSSKGNASIVYTDDTKILIDAGISIAELEMKLEALSISPRDISAILITHEHGDHIKSVGAMNRKYGTPIYCHIGAYDSLITKLGRVRPNTIYTFTDRLFSVGDMVIEGYKLPHDVPFCCGFNIYHNARKISFATDLGHITEEIIAKFYDSRMVILESNHDEGMLMANPKYSYPLKQRIKGDHGHLSNIVCAKVISRLAVNNVKQMVLAHLSEENNTPELCYNTVTDYLRSVGVEPEENIKIFVAHPYNMSPIFHISS
ncbi:MAG: MBL fold metallo-hydrolase [Clostridiales bacterium]|nr:MBL fold metallo-hydrolase [Clostridiales bacterium]